MNKEIGIGIALTAAIAAGVTYYYGLWPKPQAPEPVISQAPVAPAPEPIQYPVPAPAQETPLPALADSDEIFRASLEQLYGKPPLDAWLIPQNLIARLVATIDSLDRKEPVALRTRSIPAVDKPLVVDTAAGKVFLSPKNSERYKPLVAALQSVDGKTVAELYIRYYPLFQQAYVELGYPGGYFNDRLIKVIDHLLETPDSKGPHELVRPTVAYRFADPKLEQRSSGQKLLLRLGPGQAGIIKAKLREIRTLIALQSSDPV